MEDPKNLTKLFSDIPDVDLPKGFDARFNSKWEDQKNQSNFGRWMSSVTLPTNLNWAVALGSILLVSLSVFRLRNHYEDVELAINDELDMLTDLDILMEWDGEV